MLFQSEQLERKKCDHMNFLSKHRSYRPITSINKLLNLLVSLVVVVPEVIVVSVTAEMNGSSPWGGWGKCLPQKSTAGWLGVWKHTWICSNDLSLKKFIISCSSKI